MKALAFALVALLSLAGPARAEECPSIEKQDYYTMTAKWFTLGNDFHIFVGEALKGSVVQKLLRNEKTFELLNEKRQLVAKAVQQGDSKTVVIDVFDCRGNKIGGLQEDIVNSLFKIGTVYFIVDADGKVIGESRKIDWLGTNINFFDSDGEYLAGVSHRSSLAIFSEKWNLRMNPAKSADLRLLLFAAAYKSAADAERRAEEKKKKREEFNRSFPAPR